jgi:hypothetical protein
MLQLVTSMRATCCAGACSYLLQTQFAGEFCLYCYASAAFSLSIFATALFGMPTRTVRQAAVPSLLGAGLGAFVLLASGLGSPDRSAAEDFELAYAVSCHLLLGRLWWWWGSQPAPGACACV